MTTKDMQMEALDRARSGQKLTNLPTIYREFMARGIAEADIQPRVNVLTYNAWRALNRHVRRGEKGVHIITFLPTSEKKDSEGTVVHRGGSRPWSAIVFHVTQTDAD